MEILYYLNEFPKLSETFVLNEIYELDRRGHDVSVVALTHTDDAIDHSEFRELDVDIGYVGYPDASFVTDVFSKASRYGVATGARTPGLARKVGTTYLGTRAIRTALELGCSPNHVHGHFLDWYKFGAHAVADYFDASCTVTAHAYGLFRSPDEPLLSALIEGCDRLITISAYNRRYLEDEFAPSTPIDIVHAGIRPEKFSPRRNEVDGRVLTIGRLVEKKGVGDAVRAVARLVEQFPNIEYDVIGSGPLESDLDELSELLDITDRVNLLGSVTDERLLQELNTAQAFVLPCVVAPDGDRDGIPVALMEAMAMEVTPVSTHVSGVPELITDEEDGVLVEPRAPDQLADAIGGLLANPERRRRLARAGRATIEGEFDIRTQVTKLERSFNVAYERRNRTGG